MPLFNDWQIGFLDYQIIEIYCICTIYERLRDNLVRLSDNLVHLSGDGGAAKRQKDKHS